MEMHCAEKLSSFKDDDLHFTTLPSRQTIYSAYFKISFTNSIN